MKHAKDFAWLSSANMLRVALALGIGSALTHFLRPDEMGQMALLLSIASFLNSTVLYWLNLSLVRFGSEAKERNGALYDFLVTRAPLVILAFAAVAALVWTPPAIAWIRLAGAEWHPILSLLILWGVFRLFIQDETKGLAQVLERFDMLAAQSVSANAIWICCLLTLIFARVTIGAVTYLSLAWSVEILVCVFWIILLARTERKQFCGPPKARNSWKIGLRQMTAHSSPQILVSALGFLSYYGDHWLIRSLLSLAHVGQFQVAYFLFLTIRESLAGPLTRIILPRIVRQQVQGRQTAVEDIRFIFPLLQAAWVAIILIGGALTPELYRLIFSSKYADGMQPFLVLLAGSTMATLSTCYSPYFNLQARLSRTIPYHASCVATNLSISMLLLPYFGILGSAIGTAISMLVIGTAYVGDQQRYYGVKECGQVAMGYLTSAVVIVYAIFSDMPWVRLTACLSGLVLLLILCRRAGYFADGRSALSPAIPRPLSQILDRLLISGLKQ